VAATAADSCSKGNRKTSRKFCMVGGQKKHKGWDSRDCRVPQVRYPFQTSDTAALSLGVRMPQGEAHNLPYPVLTSSWHSTVPHQLVRE